MHRANAATVSYTEVTVSSRQATMRYHAGAPCRAFKHYARHFRLQRPMPVFGTILAWLLLGERLEPFHVAGIALILTGIYITSRKAPPPVPAAPE